MFLSNWRKKKEFKRNIIYGDQLIERWDIDIHQLSYIILKQDLSVLNLPNKLRLHNIFEPNYYKIEQDELIEIIHFKPKSLSDKAFWIPEINKANNYFKSLTEKYKKETNYYFAWPN